MEQRQLQGLFGNQQGDNPKSEGVVGKDLSEARGDGETKCC